MLKPPKILVGSIPSKVKQESLEVRIFVCEGDRQKLTSLCLRSVVMGEDSENVGKVKNGLIRDNRLVVNSHIKDILKQKSKLNNMERSNFDRNEMEIEQENNNNKMPSTKMDDNVKHRRISESCLPHDGESSRVSHHVRRRVLNGGVSPVNEEAQSLRSRTLDSEKLLYRSRSYTPTRLHHEKTHHMPTWDIIDTDEDR